MAAIFNFFNWLTLSFVSHHKTQLVDRRISHSIPNLQQTDNDSMVLLLLTYSLADLGGRARRAPP